MIRYFLHNNRSFHVICAAALQHPRPPIGDVGIHFLMHLKKKSMHTSFQIFIFLTVPYIPVWWMDRVKWPTNYSLQAGYQQQHGTRTSHRRVMHGQRWPDGEDVFWYTFVDSLYVLVTHYFPYKNIWWIDTLFLWMSTFSIYSIMQGNVVLKLV